MLSEAQIERFWRDGCLVAKDAVTPAQRAALRADPRLGRGEPCAQATVRPADARRAAALRHGRRAFGRALGAAPGHHPSGIPAAFRAVMEASAMVDMVADLIGPDVKFHRCKNIGVVS